MFLKYSMDELSKEERESMPESTIHLAVMVLMGLRPAGIEMEDGIDKYSYFIKCKEIIGKRVPTL